MKGSTKWYLQRFTSLTLVPISYWFVIFFLNNLNLSSENFVNSLDSNFVKLLIIIFFLCCCISYKIKSFDNL